MEDNYVEKIDVFVQKYEELRISCPLKIHMLSHVQLFLERKFAQGFPRVGLGNWSEQAFESCHSSWKKHWQKYKDSKLLKSII